MMKKPRMPSKRFVFIWALILVTSLSPSTQKTDRSEIAVLVSPRMVTPGMNFRVLIASEKDYTKANLNAVGPGGALQPFQQHHGGGPPFWWTASFKAKKVGQHRIWLADHNSQPVEKVFDVTQHIQQRDPTPFIWQTQQHWTREIENLYSAWIEFLFLSAQEGDTWNPLHEVTRHPQNNLLHNHLGLNEDNSLILEPDCADNPFIFRAYFAWKLALPYGHHTCDRGSTHNPPRCTTWSSNHSLRKPGQSDLKAFQMFTRIIMNTIHSGSARTRLSDDHTDLYPLALTRKDLRPGVVFADPYGHTLMISRWIPQVGRNSGQMLAVDAQPDGTIGIRRFWQGNFLFSTQNVIGEPGFKGFRPIFQEKGRLRLLNNQEIASIPAYGNYSLQQQHMPPQAFYDTMDRLINPQPLNPIQAFQELHDAVHERLHARVIAVANGEKYMQQNDYQVIPMPSGARIFQTSGHWEDFSTPARDMRLLISLDVLLDFPDKVIRNPAAFAIPSTQTPAALKSELESLHRVWAKDKTITYTRSNGSEQILSLADILGRIEALEMGYNPNDCIEIRWGATEGSPEFVSCQRRAPAEQHQKMLSYRRWFRERIFPMR